MNRDRPTLLDTDEPPDRPGITNDVEQCKQQISRKLRDRRLACGEDLENVARALAVTPSELSDLEHGKFGQDQLSLLSAYATHLRLTGTHSSDAGVSTHPVEPPTSPDSPDAAAITAFANFLELRGQIVDQTHLRRHLGPVQQIGLQDLLRTAKMLELKARIFTCQWRRLTRMPLPALATTRDGGFMIIARVDAGGERLLVSDTAISSPHVLTRAEFETVWSGDILLVSPSSAATEMPRGGITWILPTISKYKVLLTELLSASLFLQLIELATPLFFQIVVDKVLVHRSWNTLDVITIALIIFSLSEFVLSGLRSKLLAETATKIDVELGGRLYRRLISLPLSYFGARRVGDSVARMRELERIREFLGGSALTVSVDLLFTIIFISVVFLYSRTLAFIVMVAIAAYIILTVSVVPFLRRRLEEQYTHCAANQAFIVETVTGIETLKSMAAEVHLERRWSDQLSAYAKSSFRVTTLAEWAGHGVQLISKLMILAIIYVGAGQVAEGVLSIGGLVAVNMIAARIITPVLRLSQMWQELQEVRLAMSRLNDILNTAPELGHGPSRTTLSELRGDLAFEDVTFRYPLSSRDVLTSLNLQVCAGQVVGIVGSSGSGKSTLARLIQRLHLPNSGRVLIDGVDLTNIDVTWLRTQIGVVPQESFLLNMSVRDNISLANPSMSMDEIMNVAKLAGAHDFICELADGYDTNVGERGSALSGGQRQRLAIARALATSPRILVLDEATSALDYESERVIKESMKRIAVGRTILIIAHRLSAVRDADRIITIDQGRVVEDGAHDQLLRSGGRYAALHRAQSASLVVV